MYAQSALPFEATYESGQTGLAGTVQVKLVDNDGGETIAATTTNITEIGATGIYVWNAPAAPATGSLAQYTIIWSDDGSFDADHSFSEELLVFTTIPTPSPLPTPDSEPSTMGPCSTWITGDDVAECCAAAVSDVGTYTVLLDDAADVASQLLYELSGRRFAGLCEREGVRPCHGDCGCAFQVLSRGHIVGDYHSSCSGRGCWCRDLSRVKLAGYVRSVTQVKIGGVVLASSEYRVDEHKYLTRLNGRSLAELLARRPRGHGGRDVLGRLHLREDAPHLGDRRRQAVRLPDLPAVRLERWRCRLRHSLERHPCHRQGITVERSLFQRNAQTGAWETGMGAVDFFLNSVNPKGLMRNGLFFGPRKRFARPVG